LFGLQRTRMSCMRFFVIPGWQELRCQIERDEWAGKQ
jgi:hypothetical protein